MNKEVAINEMVNPKSNVPQKRFHELIKMNKRHKSLDSHMFSDSMQSLHIDLIKKNYFESNIPD